MHEGGVEAGVEVALEVGAAFGRGTDEEELVQRPLGDEFDGEFEANRVRMSYPPDVVATARPGIRLATAAVVAPGWPLDGSADLLLGQLMAAQSPL